MKRVVIIGSGLGGLSTAYILQKNGYQVTVLEQSHVIGGCLQCFIRSGVKFETGMHFIGSAAPGQTMNRMMRYLSLGDVPLVRLDTSAYDTINLQGQRFHFPNGREAFLERFTSYFPNEEKGLHRYIDIVNRIASASTLNSLTSENRDMAANTEYQTRSINEVLDSLFKDELLKKVLVGNLPLYSAELNKTPFSQHAYIFDFYNQSAFRIAGGSDAISFSLADSIRKMGGEVITKKKVRHILCDDNHAIGAETHDEQFYPADYVISTIHPNRLLELLDTRLIRPAFRTRINSIPQTSAGFAVYVKFRKESMPYMNTNFFSYTGDTPWNCEYYTEETWPKGYLYMHMAPLEGIESDGYAESGVILSYMNFSDVSRWVGTRVGRRGEDYEDFKRIHAEKLISQVNNDIPGFSSRVESYYTSTPLTYLDYTGTEAGSMYGVAHDINLGPAGRVPYRTKIPNLLLAGQNVNSHGMLGVLVGTIVTCSELVPAEVIYSQIKEANQNG